MTADELRASILQLAIEGKLVPQLDNEPEVEQIGDAPEEVPFEIPNKWKWVQLKEVSIKAKQEKPVQDFDYIDVSSINNLFLKKLNFTKWEKAPSRARKVVENGMLLFSTVRPYLKNICLIEHIKKYTVASTAFASFLCSKEALNSYVFSVLISQYWTSQVNQLSRGVAYPAITDKDFFSIYIPLPPLEEQKRIVEKLNELMKLQSSLQG